MAIRLRKIKGIVTALCAAKSSPLKGDHYINDGEHLALTRKFEKDFQSMGFMKENKFISTDVMNINICYVCGGTGIIEVRVNYHDNCNRCNGTGYIK